MPHPITIPRLGWSMEEGVLTEWLKAPDQLVQSGDMLYVLEGEKALQEIESFESGMLCIPDDAPRVGQTVKVGQVIGFLLAQGELPPPSVGSASCDALSHSPTSSDTPILSDTTYITSSVRPAADSTVAARHPIATPRARRRAQELGIDWTQLIGSGQDGRIRETDVLKQQMGYDVSPNPAAVSSDPIPATPGKHVKATKLRLALAQRMVAGVTQASPVTLTTKVDASGLVRYRAELKSQSSDGSAPGGSAPSYNDILVYLAAQSLRELPELNACWYRNGIYFYDQIHIASAVDTPSGLLAPVIRHADRLSISQIAASTRQLAMQARQSTLSMAQLAGGTFSVSNLGMFGIDGFSPILNLPQAGVLGIGRIIEEPVVRDGSLAIGHTLTLSLTFDHRVLDGAPAARWLQQLSQRLLSLPTP